MSDREYVRRRGWAVVGLAVAAIVSTVAGGPAAAGPPALRPTSRPAAGKLVCVGDSITAGEGVAADQSFVGRLRTRAATELHVDLTVVNDGRSGWTTDGYVHSAKKVVGTMPADATVVVILLGTNDARSKDPADKVAAAAAANVEKLIALYRAKAPAATFVIAGPPAVFPDKLSDRLRKADYGPRTVENLVKVRAAYRAAADRLGLVYVDLSSVPSSAEKSIDGVHPTADGHAEVADAIWAALCTEPPATRPTTKP